MIKLTFIRYTWLFLFAFLSIKTASRAQTRDIVQLRSGISKLTDSMQRIDVYTRLGMLYTNRSLDSCYYFGARALDLSKRLNYSNGKAEALNVLAFYYAEKGNFYLAYKYINEALTLFRAVNRPEKVREAIMNRGVILITEGKFPEALKQYQEAYDLPSDRRSDSIMPLVTLNLAVALYQTKTYPEVRYLFEKSERLAREQGNERFLIAVRQAKNGIGFQKKDIRTEDAIREQYAIIAKTKAMGYEFFTAVSLMEMGNMFLERNIDSALNYYDQAIELTKASGYSLAYFHMMSQAYETLKRIKPLPQKAVIYGTKILELINERELEEQKDGLNYLQLAINEEHIAKEQAKQKQRQLTLLLSSLIGFSAVLFAVVLFWMYRGKRRIAQELAVVNDRLAEQNGRLEQNNILHQRVIAVMSHDLRQPLASIAMFCDTAMSAQLSDIERAYVFKQLKLTANSSAEVLDSLVQWMKLSALGMAYEPVSVPLKASIEQALAFSKTTAEQKSLLFKDEVDDSLLIRSQPTMLQFINRNLISNAVRHSPTGGVITISARIEQQYVTVCLSDQGNGIPEDLLGELFTKERIQARGQIVDSGLALVLCHEMIGQMNGTIWAQNNSKGGASFCYRLPVA